VRAPAAVTAPAWPGCALIEAIELGAVPDEITVAADGRSFQAVARIDTPGEAGYYRHGGIMQYVLQSLR